MNTKTPELARWQKKNPYQEPPSDPEEVCRAIREAKTRGELHGALFVVALWLLLPHSLWEFLRKLVLMAVGVLGFATG